MAAISPISDPPLGMGLTATILGSVGALLFFMPVLGIPLAAVGLVFGIVGLLVALLSGRTSLRWSAAGIVVSGLALGIGLAIALAPAGFLPNSKGPPVEQSVPDRPYVPPPARPGELNDLSRFPETGWLLSEPQRRPSQCRENWGFAGAQPPATLRG